MMRPFLLDTGPLVALVIKREQHHEWAKSQVEGISGAMLSCESVLSEACHLLRHTTGGADAVMRLVENSLIEIPFRLAEHATAVSSLMAKYADVPMSLADACLVRMSEMYEDRAIFTFDSDFTLYRKHGRHVIRTLMPPPVQ
jgi:predicted nucleic acid-binding protein